MIRIADFLFDILIVTGVMLLAIVFPEKFDVVQIIFFSCLCIGIVLFIFIGSQYSNKYISKGFSILLLFANNKAKQTIFGIIQFARQAPINHICTGYLLPDIQKEADEQIASFNKATLLLCKLAFAQRKFAKRLLSGYCTETYLEMVFRKEDIKKFIAK